jgi:hypothetical protein
LNAPGGAAADEIAEPEEIGVGNEIKDAVAAAAATDETAVIEGLKVLRNIGLCAAEGRGDFADGAFAIFKELENAEAVGLPEEAEAAGDSLEDALIGKGAKSFFGHRGNFPLDYRTIEEYSCQGKLWNEP